MKNLVIKLLANAVALADRELDRRRDHPAGRDHRPADPHAADRRRDLRRRERGGQADTCKLLSLPFIILTLGLLLFVINAAMLLLTSWITGKLDVQFHVDGFWSALLGALVITVVGMLLNAVLPDKAEIK